MSHLAISIIVLLQSVFAFGFQIPIVGTGFCAAMNPCRHTYAIAQTGKQQVWMYCTRTEESIRTVLCTNTYVNHFIGIIPPIGLVGLLQVTIDALGFSLNKDLQSRTLNTMWEGGEVEPGESDLIGILFEGQNTEKISL